MKPNAMWPADPTILFLSSCELFNSVFGRKDAGAASGKTNGT